MTNSAVYFTTELIVTVKVLEKNLIDPVQHYFLDQFTPMLAQIHVKFIKATLILASNIYYSVLV